MGIMRRIKALNHAQLNSTHGVNFNATPEVNLSHPPTRQSTAPVFWGQNNSPLATPTSPTFNNVNNDKDQYYARQWNTNLNNETVNIFYKSIARGPKIDFPKFDGSNPLEWIRQIETYFAIANVRDEAKFDQA